MTHTVHLLAQIRDVGGLPVARLLPQRGRRSIGPWCFLDHLGPVALSAQDRGMQVGQHPHINLQTFTWMLDGVVVHQDSLGSRQLIRRHQLNLMTAGRGIVHTESSVAATQKLHAVQLWLALPPGLTVAPSFHHYPQLPQWSQQGVDYVLCMGRYADRQSPALCFSEQVCLDMVLQTATATVLMLQPMFEYGVLVVSGAASVDGVHCATNELVYVPAGRQHLHLTATMSPTHVLLIGGVPRDDEWVMWWNFIAADKRSIAEAVRDWQQHHPRFGTVANNMPRLQAPPVPWLDVDEILPSEPS